MNLILSSEGIDKIEIAMDKQQVYVTSALSSDE